MQAAECPQKAFRLPRSFHLPIAFFKMKDGHEVAAALELLRSLDVNHMLRHAATALATANADSQDETSAKMTAVGSDDRGRVPPLFVSLIGLSPILFSPTTKPIGAASVPMDSTNRLHLISHQIHERFLSAGFEKSTTRGDDSKYESDVLRPNILNVEKAKSWQRVVDEHGQEAQKKKTPDFDALGLIEKYKDVVLAESIPLEKLSLCKNGRKAKFQGSKNQILSDEYYEEVGSNPLPQET